MSPAKRKGWSPTLAFVLGQIPSAPEDQREKLPPPTEKVAAKTALYAAALRDRLSDKPQPNTTRHDISPASDRRDRELSAAMPQETQVLGVGAADPELALVAVKMRSAKDAELQDPEYEACVDVDEHAGNVQVRVPGPQVPEVFL